MKAYTLETYYNIVKEAGLISSEAPCPVDLKDAKDTLVTGLTYDSNEVHPGSFFICKGLTFKPQYLIDAINNGAIAYISETKYDVDAPYILVSDIRKTMPYLAEKYFNSPADFLNLTGITGTKGKSTTAYYIKAIVDDYLKDIGKPESAVISSIDVYDGVTLKESHITTPENVELLSHFRNAVNSGIDYLEMEVSSQALKYNRVDRITFDVGIFMNISEDHISAMEHPSFEDYFESKLRIFPQTETAIINTDSDHFDVISEAAKAAKRVITFGTKEGADIYGSHIRKVGSEIHFRVHTDRFDHDFALTMPGLFNVENALAAVATAYVYNIPVKYIESGLRRARSKGRMECYTSKDNRMIAVVDYAHNKLSFEKLFSSTREEYPDYDIVAIFGCPGKKALIRRRHLGTIAGQYANKVYLVAEDPGEEPVIDISTDIAQYVAAENCPYEMIEDRGTAIEKAILSAENKTVFLITGKGDETRQKYGREYLDYPSDVELTKKALQIYDQCHPVQ